MTPSSVGGYRIEAVLGRGGMGTVFRALAPDGRAVALKRLDAEAAGHESVQRFLREARLRIGHPNVVETLGAGLDVRGQPYIVFELLSGESFRDRLERGPLEITSLLSVVLQVCRGLAAAHALGVVHRDVKPSNVFLCDGGVTKVLDFGVARLAAETRWLTGTGDVIGTPSYLSPEQARGERDVDARADVWAAGLLLYRGLVGCAPFDRADVVSTLIAVIEEEAPPLERAAPEVPPDLAAAVHRCLRKDPRERWSTIDELAGALEAVRVRLRDAG